MTDAKRAAVIAIGSNSTRMLAAQLDAALSSPFRGREETRLFLSLDEEKRFAPATRQRLADAVNTLKEKAILSGALDISLIATSAVRDSRDSDELIVELKDKTGLALQIVSGEMEARYSFLGAAYPYQAAVSVGVIDIGGGSTEVALGGAQDGVRFAQSLQMGASRLYNLKAIDAEQDVLKAGRAVENEMDRAGLSLPFVPRQWLLVGGTGVALMGLMKGELVNEYHPADEAFSLEDAQMQLRRLASLTPAERAALPGMTPSREHILPTGLVILTTLMRRLGIEHMAVTTRNNCDGFLFDKYLKEQA